MIIEKEIFELTDEELNAPLKFFSYYKHCFTFRGTLNGNEIIASIGQENGDIYRMEVETEKEYTINGGVDGHVFEGVVSIRLPNPQDHRAARLGRSDASACSAVINKD